MNVRDLAVDAVSRIPARVQTKLLVAFLAMSRSSSCSARSDCTC
jgi:hypothetical protein